METILFGHVSLGMLLAFLLGVVGLFLVSYKSAKATALKSGYGVKKYLKPTVFNIIYQLVLGFAILFILHEISEKLIGLIGWEESSGYHLTLSMACGAFGGQIFAYALELGRKLLNKRDNNVVHVHDKNCNN